MASTPALAHLQNTSHTTKHASVQSKVPLDQVNYWQRLENASMSYAKELDENIDERMVIVSAVVCALVACLVIFFWFVLY